jgi:predicted nucleic acid-binding protein
VAVARFLADKSALARLNHPAVASFLEPLLENGLVASCPLVDLELLYSCRSASEYDTVLEERRGFENLDVEPADWSRAMEVQRLLAHRSQLRAVGIADLLLAALAERQRVTLLHYDRDFDVVAAVTDQPMRWVVPAGSVP